MMSSTNHMLTFAKKLASSKGLQQSALTVFGNGIASGVSGIAMILISRILGPSEFGEFSVGFSVIIMLSSINALGVNVVLMRLLPNFETAEQKNRLISYTLWIKILMYLLLAALSTVIIFMFRNENFSDPKILLTSVVALLGVMLYEHVLAVLQSLHRFKEAVVVNLTQSFAKIVLALLLSVIHIQSAFWLLVAYSVGPFLPALAWKKFVPQSVRLITSGSFIAEKNLTWSIVKHSAFGLMVVGVSDYVDVLFIRGNLSAYETGLFGGVSKIALFVMLFAYSIGSVLYPRVARYKNASDLSLYLKKATLLSLAAVTGYFVFMPFGSLLIRITIGSDYLPGLPILYSLMAAAVLTFIIVPFQALFYSFDAPWYFSITGIMQLIVVLVGNSIFVPIYGLEAAAWTRLASRALLTVFTVVIGLALYQQKYRTPKKAFYVPNQNNLPL